MTSILVAVAIATHFILVVYTHWKNFGRSAYEEQADEKGDEELGDKLADATVKAIADTILK